MAITRNKIKELLRFVNEISSHKFELRQDALGYTLYKENHAPVASCLTTREMHAFVSGYYNALIQEIS